MGEQSRPTNPPYTLPACLPSFPCLLPVEAAATVRPPSLRWKAAMSSSLSLSAPFPTSSADEGSLSSLRLPVALLGLLPSLDILRKARITGTNLGIMCVLSKHRCVHTAQLEELGIGWICDDLQKIDATALRLPPILARTKLGSS